jgi:hypothetical protein
MQKIALVERRKVVERDPRERKGDRTGLGWAWAGRPRPASLAHPEVGSAPHFLSVKIFNPKYVEVPPFTEEESQSPERPSTS